MGGYANSILRCAGTGGEAWCALLDSEREAIKAVILASDDSWLQFTSRGGSSGNDVITPWDKILPIFPGKDAKSLGSESYKISDYNKFFENYLLAGSSGGYRNTDPKFLAKKKPPLEYIKNYSSKNSALDESTAVDLWNFLDKQTFSTDLAADHVVGSPAAPYQASAPYMKSVYNLFSYLSGIPADELPVRLPSQSSVLYGFLYDSWRVLGPTPLVFDFQDYLLWSYLTISNPRLDAQQRLKDLADAAKLDEFETANPEGAKDATAALEIRAAQKVNAKIKSGQKLTATEMELLRALAKGDMNFFSAKLRETDQCILRLNLESFLSTYYNHLTRSGPNPYAQRRLRPHKSIYQDSMTPATIMNKIAYSPNSGPFLNARTHEVSQLMPMIRLFKTYYNDETNDIDEEVEFYFDGGITAEQALEGRTGVGIKSFEWDLNATNPATVRNDITATLTLYFQGFKELSSIRKGRDLVSGKQKDFQYQDLLIRPQRGAATAPQNQTAPLPGSISCSGRDNSIYDPRFYEVKALVGWAPPARIDSDSTKTSGFGHPTPLVRSINSQQIPLFLTLIDHEFSFTQEGTFELKITYRARMEAINSDPRLDVLTTPSRKSAINALQREIEEARKNCDSKEAIDDMKDEIAIEREADRDRLASSIIRGLEPYIYISEVDTSKIHEALLGLDNSATGATALTGIAIDWPKMSNTIQNKNADLKEDIIKELEGKQVTSSGKGTRKQREEAEKAVSGGAKVEDLNNLKGLSDPKVTRIPWFYFGDLVDIVVSHAIDNNTVGGKKAPGIIPGIELENLVYLMGTYDYAKIGKWSDTTTPGGIKVLTPSEITHAVGQISSVPVTVAAYNSWFIKNVVNAERSNFPLAEFLKSFIQQVILPFLNRKCFDTDNFKKLWAGSSTGYGGHRPWIEIAPLISKSAAISLPPWGNQNPLEKFRTVPHKNFDGTISSSEIDLSLFEPASKKISSSSGRIPTKRENAHEQTIKDSYHLSVFYLVGQDSYRELGPPTSGEDRESRDFKKGVYHLYLGADVGLVKEVTFSKVDAPYLREARMQQDSLNPLAQLAATYNVNLKMVGNTIFWPGQYIFVNPVGFGTGSPTDLGSVSNQLGLGGYHLVTQVKSYVEDGKYETTVKGLFEFSGDGCPSLPQSTPQDPCEPDSPPGTVTEQDGPNMA